MNRPLPLLALAGLVLVVLVGVALLARDPDRAACKARDGLYIELVSTDEALCLDRVYSPIHRR